MNYGQKALALHEKAKGKIEVRSKVPVNNRDDLSTAYTPGVAEPCRQIHKNPEDVYRYTSRGNMVAVVSDGTAVLGLGDIGPLAAMPVMEGKAVLFKSFANVDAFPVCLDTKDVDEIVRTVEILAPSFGGINLEDIAAPRCYKIEEELKKRLDIPVFHDDQHGTAVVCSAAVINGMKILKKNIEDIKVVINGIGSAGSAIARLLLHLGVKRMVLCDRHGILYPGNPVNDFMQEDLAAKTNPEGTKGSLADAMRGADVFIGVSAPNIVTEEMICSMNEDSLVLAMANPDPEIDPVLAKKAGARIVGTGRSDYPNQVNNVLAFPGIFRGALDVRASDINEEMKIAAAYAIASVIPDDELNENNILPGALDERVAPAVASAVAEAARKSGVARL
ncbi:MAG: NAD(P)-dependent malic enzyme [Caldicoprobacterales bacterium]|jgi:malate dehydrogenase (oxaloacetate-decarboxylating)|nr:NAD-dependent malic enzyme [Clostridiales bacterium]